MPEKEVQQETTPAKQDNSLAIVSMVLGIVSLTGPGLLLGIPAIITASIALKQKRDGRGMSIAGLATGIISTVLSLLFIVLIITLAIWSAAHPEDFESSPSTHKHQSEQMFDSSRT
jgi:O-antigen/teichoic acid export membrane protein